LKQEEWEAQKKELVDRAEKFESRFNHLSEFERKEADLEADRARLREEIENEKKDKIRALADKDREKV